MWGCRQEPSGFTWSSHDDVPDLHWWVAGRVWASEGSPQGPQRLSPDAWLGTVSPSCRRPRASGLQPGGRADAGPRAAAAGRAEQERCMAAWLGRRQHATQPTCCSCLPGAPPDDQDKCIQNLHYCASGIWHGMDMEPADQLGQAGHACYTRNTTQHKGGQLCNQPVKVDLDGLHFGRKLCCARCSLFLQLVPNAPAVPAGTHSLEQSRQMKHATNQSAASAQRKDPQGKQELLFWPARHAHVFFFWLLFFFGVRARHYEMWECCQSTSKLQA